MSEGYSPPELLAGHHDLTQFRCSSTEQTEWLCGHARQAANTGTTRVFVVTAHNSTRVVAYYAWCMAQIDAKDAPGRLLKGAGRYPQPVALLARLGVDIEHEGRGLGYGLLQDVILRLVAISDAIGCRGLIVHAESTEARGFYRHLVPEFEDSPTDSSALVLLIKDIRKTIQGR
ncbi:MAG: GNAT family N-acetyltransferase [Actinobacteria bacterium]|nr:GNAT family N-acetyltransferase [Actinomycetota bacterium]